jgi:hypothetical protein
MRLGLRPFSSPAPDAAQQKRREPGPRYFAWVVFDIFVSAPQRQLKFVKHPSAKLSLLA